MSCRARFRVQEIKAGVLPESPRMSRSGMVREALIEWIRKREVEDVGQERIARLKERPQDIEDVDVWMHAEHLSES